MDQLSKYLDRDLRGAIRSMRVQQGKAKDSGNVYYYIELIFNNGYNKRLFLSSDETFAWCNAFEMLETNKVIDNEF